MTLDAVVVDTDVVSFEFKGDSRAREFRPHLIGRIQVISFMTLAELELWSLERDWGHSRREKLERHVRRFLLHPFDRLLCQLWAQARDTARRNGRPLGVGDAWVAATALALGIPLVTNNPGDYAGVPNLTIRSQPIS